MPLPVWATRAAEPHSPQPRSYPYKLIGSNRNCPMLAQVLESHKAGGLRGADDLGDRLSSRPTPPANDVFETDTSRQATGLEGA